MEPRLRDLPPFDKAPELPDWMWIPDLWGFNSFVYIWRDYKERRQQRREQGGRLRLRGLRRSR
ncbi:MAG TPA: hypothetical protein VE972_06290 [Conexibacter sp.]|nr:hypothetical protein [Conexibacter sp.]